MVAVSKPKKVEIITRAPFVHHDIGEIVAFHDEEGPTIDVTIRPEGSEDYARFALTAIDAHQLAYVHRKFSPRIHKAIRTLRAADMARRIRG
jgi:hypothetical protein